MAEIFIQEFHLYTIAWISLFMLLIFSLSVAYLMIAIVDYLYDKRIKNK